MRNEDIARSSKKLQQGKISTRSAEIICGRPHFCRNSRHMRIQATEGNPSISVACSVQRYAHSN